MIIAIPSHNPFCSSSTRYPTAPGKTGQPSLSVIACLSSLCLLPKKQTDRGRTSGTSTKEARAEHIISWSVPWKSHEIKKLRRHGKQLDMSIIETAWVRNPNVMMSHSNIATRVCRDLHHIVCPTRLQHPHAVNVKGQAQLLTYNKVLKHYVPPVISTCLKSVQQRYTSEDRRPRPKAGNSSARRAKSRRDLVEC